MESTSETTSSTVLMPSSDPSLSITKPPSHLRSMTYPPLLNLPLELHHIISSYLSPSSYLSFRLTHPHTYHSLPPPKQPSIHNLDACGRIAVRTYLAPLLATAASAENPASMFSQINSDTAPSAPLSSTSSQEKEIRCALCKAVYPEHLFRSVASSACAKTDLGAEHMDGMGCPAPGNTSPTQPATSAAAPEREAREMDVVELPDRVCAWHVGRLIRVVHVESASGVTGSTPPPSPLRSPSSQQQQQPRIPQSSLYSPTTAALTATATATPGTWTSTTSPLCMHCGAVRAWRRCNCACDSCGEREARIYTRTAERGWRLKRAVFWRDGRGGLWVREVGVGREGEGRGNGDGDGRDESCRNGNGYVDKRVVFE
ncbi:hypothetical protein K490DRAFT_66690 [Saccharata proteae CBS 121410]|uniref:F-box domain-containing protein n=1 Tax=Saccharata proteae CBS 121410 TaxID=1314787 RepID=A0A9P4HV48_9PEZI|nr:hypothetical protein K490DRAFT_66690 [Saccharata proteae CBS 121410]